MLRFILEDTDDNGSLNVKWLSLSLGGLMSRLGRKRKRKGLDIDKRFRIIFGTGATPL